MTGLVDTRRAPLRHPAVAAFGAWNALVWLGRIRNILQDDGLSVSSTALWMIPALVFGLGGVATLVGWWRGDGRLAPVVTAVAVAVLVYWPVRTVVMLFGGHDAAFVAVHLVLAVVSVALAAWVLARSARAIRSARSARSDGRRLRGPMAGLSDR